MNEFQTQRMEAYQPNKPGRIATIKALTPIILSVLSIIGSIFIALLQSSTSDKISENSKNDSQSKLATEQKIEFVVSQINTSIIPSMQSTIKGLIDQNMELRERLVALETKLDMQREASFVGRLYSLAGKKDTRKSVKATIPKLRIKK